MELQTDIELASIVYAGWSPLTKIWLCINMIKGIKQDCNWEFPFSFILEFYWKKDKNGSRFAILEVDIVVNWVYEKGIILYNNDYFEAWNETRAIKSTIMEQNMLSIICPCSSEV